jgi:hypothetical protein
MASPKDLETLQREVCQNQIRMLTEGIHADITFEAQDGTVKAHRCLLATISPVFAAMFSNDMVEQISSVIKLPDISSEALRTFLNFVYSGSDGSSGARLDEHWFEVLGACHKYCVTSDTLKAICAKSMEKTLNFKNCWLSLEKVSILDPARVQAGPFRICLDYIIKNFDEVVKEESFLAVAMREPALIVDVVRAAREASKPVQQPQVMPRYNRY